MKYPVTIPYRKAYIEDLQKRYGDHNFINCNGHFYIGLDDLTYIADQCMEEGYNLLQDLDALYLDAGFMTTKTIVERLRKAIKKRPDVKYFNDNSYSTSWTELTDDKIEEIVMHLFKHYKKVRNYYNDVGIYRNTAKFRYWCKNRLKNETFIFTDYVLGLRGTDTQREEVMKATHLNNLVSYLEHGDVIAEMLENNIDKMLDYAQWHKEETVISNTCSKVCKYIKGLSEIIETPIRDNYEGRLVKLTPPVELVFTFFDKVRPFMDMLEEFIPESEQIVEALSTIDSPINVFMHAKIRSVFSAYISIFYKCHFNDERTVRKLPKPKEFVPSTQAKPWAIKEYVKCISEHDTKYANCVGYGRGWSASVGVPDTSNFRSHIFS